MSHNQQPMSIEAMLDMERKEVLALLENRPRPQPAMQGAMRSASPYATPRSPVRSMLDVGGNQPAPGSPRQAPVRSMLDTTSPPPPRVRSMLDTETPLSAAKPSGTSTTPNSPVMTKASLAPATAGHTRSFSDAASNPVEFGPRAAAAASRNDPTAGYQFSDIITRNSGQQLPKRNTQGGKKPSGNALSEALRNSDLSGLQLPGESDRKRSWFGGNSSRKSKSPHNRLGSRSRSPHITQTLNPGTAMLDDGTIVDLSSAYRRLSDANLAYSTGSLSTLPMRKRENSESGRMVKDYLGPDGEVLGSSEEDEPYSSDDEDRGRKKAPRSLNPDVVGQSSDDKERRKSLSLLAAAEEERVTVSSKQPKYRSLLDEPEIKVTTPLGENTRINKGSGVHPKTAYDQMSTVASANDSDEEADMDDIKRAQNLICSMSNIISTPESHRAIRMIYRGDYNKIAQQAEEEQHRLRKYLVASDLSDESTHALEWAIGTVLRDGDTLMCIYCVDEETSIGGADNSVPDDPKAMKEQAAAINTVASSRSAAPSMSAVPDFVRNSIRGDSSKNNTPNTSPAGSSRVGGERGRAEDERRHAVKQITDKVLRLLRKTTLQVRVIVEVLHCKNPKHLITEVIDLVNPTLVVIGSRGRSALKGVILGSFSNYLVTKSSVPVMVARKRLRKQGKYRGVKPVNNLSNPTARSLANAKID